MNKWHKIARTALGVLAGTSFAGMQTAGYVDGAETTAGIDAGIVRDLLTAGLTFTAVLYPKLTRASVFIKSLTNQPALDDASSEIERLRDRLDELEAGEPAPKPTRRRRRK